MIVDTKNLPPRRETKQWLVTWVQTWDLAVMSSHSRVCRQKYTSRGHAVNKVKALQMHSPGIGDHRVFSEVQLWEREVGEWTAS